METPDHPTRLQPTRCQPPPPYSAWPKDPRYHQLLVLGALILYGVVVLDFEIRPINIAIIVPTALATQWLLGRWVGLLPRFDPKSPLISSLSLTLLLRTGSPTIAALAAVVTIAGKFLLRWNGRHFFNPTNFGICAMLLITDAAWVSPGQWGSAALLAFFLAGMGSLVIRRAERSDVTLGFLTAWGALLFGRAAWLGDPWQIPFHQVANGALLVFAFFMISDPKTTPSRRSGRLLHVTAVALVAGCIRFVLYEPNELLWALVLCAPLVPLIDRWLPAPAYRWNAVPTRNRPTDLRPRPFDIEPQGATP